jgi:hypothetical protein
MFEGISAMEWWSGAAVAAMGAGLIALTSARRRRYRLFALWLAAPLLLLMASSSLDSIEHALGLALLYLLIPTLPWSLVAVTTFAIVRAGVRLTKAFRAGSE